MTDPTSPAPAPAPAPTQPTTTKEVQPPKEGVSDAVKQAFLDDQKEKQKK